MKKNTTYRPAHAGGRTSILSGRNTGPRYPYGRVAALALGMPTCAMADAFYKRFKDLEVEA